MDDRYQSAQVTEELPFGRYLVAEDSFIQRKVQIFRFAIPENVEEAEWKEAFGSSAADLGTISHPGVPIIYENGIDEEGPFAIRQLIETTSLNSQLVEGGPLSEYEGWELAHQLLEIHDAANTAKNFHGALDANHIGFITRPSGEKRYSITDYGLAEIYNRMNKTNHYFGACYLISPEQSAGESPTEKSQLYAIGQMIFHALCGGHPWIETPVEEIPNQEPLASISAYNEAIPEAMSLWLEKLIAKDPADRFSSYGEAFEALPSPIQSAPVPINATGAVYQTPVTQPVAVQPALSGTTGSIQTRQHTVSCDSAKKKSSMKLPAIIGGVILLLIVIIVVATSGGDKADSTGDEVASDSSTPFAFFDFNSEELSSTSNSGLALEPLKMRAEFARKGLHSKGKSLKLDRKHFYRLSIAGTPLANEKLDYTVSFWVMPTDSEDRVIAATSKQPWHIDGSQAISVDKHQWKPSDTPIYADTWNMVTMVCSRSEGVINIYIDGVLTGSASTDEAQLSLHSPFIYVGCDSNFSSTHKSPVLIDNLSIWDRKLKPSEIEKLVRE